MATTTAQELADLKETIAKREKGGFAAQSVGDRSYSYDSLDELSRRERTLIRRLEIESGQRTSGRTFARLGRGRFG